MTSDKWQKILKARKILGLGELASLTEIKKAYRAISKKHHPDTASQNDETISGIAMHDIIDAYETLIAYCNSYQFPLTPQEGETQEAEDWWMDRFGQDPLWSKKR